MATFSATANTNPNKSFEIMLTETPFRPRESFWRSRSCSRASRGTLTLKDLWTRSPPLPSLLPWRQVLST
ncbi:hypothetical protein N665_2591s0003 [Sinapis alba]|nr:hypothetical protein N665_2591s0003 [Sinapis alba]